MCGAVADPEGLLVRIMDRGPILPDSGSEFWSGLFDYRDPSGNDISRAREEYLELKRLPS